MTKILVTGGAGFIGSHLCDRLVGAGHEVVVIDDFSTGRRDNIAEIAEAVTVLEGDVRDIASWRDALDGTEVIFHLAALISGYDSLQEPEEYIAHNLVGLTRLLDVVRDLETSPHILFASSSTVYGDAQGHVRREAGETSPMTMYAMSKLAGEHILAMYEQLYGYRATCLRLFNVYGPRQNPDHPYANVTCKFSKAAAEGSPIKLFGDGEQTRDFIYIDDIVDAFITVAMAPVTSTHRVYNVGTGEDHSILGLIEHLEAITDRPFELKRCPPWPNDIRQIRADISRLADDHDFRAQVGLREGLSRTVAYFSQGDA